MPPLPEEVDEWLRHARGELALAHVPPAPEIPLELFCFHAQQAAEKAIKAVLLYRGIRPPWTHSIAVLLDLLPAGLVPTEDVEESRRLTIYATVTRYPSRAQVTEAQYREALRLADAVVAWATETIGA